MYDSNQIIIGVPVTPSKRTDQIFTDGFAIIVSCGGGMGGSKWKHYAEIIEENDTTTKIKTIDNREIILTNRFIVAIEPVRLVKVTYDTTAHANYHRHVCTKETQTHIFAFRGNEHCAFSHEIQHFFDNKNGEKIDKWRVFQETIQE